jgi:hypothetical protein
MPEPTNVKVTVKPPFRVVHDGKAYTDGAIVTVPKALADQWLRSQWVEPAASKEK